MKLLIYISAFLIASAACAQTPFNKSELTGFWTLEGIEGQMHSHYVLKIKSDGTFTEISTDSTTNLQYDTAAAGVWSVKDSTFSLSRLTDKKGREERNPTILKFHITRTEKTISLEFISDSKNVISENGDVIMKRKIDE